MQHEAISVLIFSWCTTINLDSSSEIPNTYDLKCPEAMQWNVLNKKYCNKTHMYSCLYDENDERYISSCRVPVAKKPGSQVKLLGGIHAGRCPNDKYQPRKFLTNETSTCVFKKTFCSEEGSVLTDNGTTRTDVKCRCDYTKGYSYIDTPINKCGCVPSEEDCSCYMKQCQTQHILSQDYMCIDQFNRTERFVCPKIFPVDIEGLPTTEDTDVVDVVQKTTTKHATHVASSRTTIYVILVLPLLCVLTFGGILLWIILSRRMHEVKTHNEDIDPGIELLAVRVTQERNPIAVKTNKDDEDSTAVKKILSEPQNTDSHEVDVDIHTAESAPKVAVCRLLLSHNASINRGDNKGRTPLIHACNAFEMDVAILLIERGADANISDDSGNTPLIIACQKNLVHFVNLLLRIPVDVNASNKKGDTALSLACGNGNAKICNLLLDQGANPNIQDNEGLTPLIHAIHCGKKEHFIEKE